MAFTVDLDAGEHANRRRVANRVGHLRGDRALPDQVVQGQLLLRQGTGHLARRAEVVAGGTDRLVRLLSPFGLGLVVEPAGVFLAEELRGADDAIEALDKTMHAEDDTSRRAAYDELREAVEDNVKIKRRLINRLDDAIELAQKRVEWNFKTAVPAFYPTKNTMSLLLPLDLTENEQPDVALVVELMESGAYIGQTILTMKMAYNNARLICRPDSDWLNTSLRLS